MGYVTDFIGHIDIEPGLNESEIQYLTAFFASRRCERDGGPYAVPGNPRADGRGSISIERYRRPAPGQPELWCPWVPCWDGCSLSIGRRERFLAPIPWLRYLIDHFLQPRALASRSEEGWFGEFTFDHRLDGMVVGCRRDSKEAFAITVVDNVVTGETLKPGDPAYMDLLPISHEGRLDAEADRRRKRKRGWQAREGAIDLAARRD